jgi:2-oxoglutarate ferredoxin oxidoreductase subunit beta
MTNSGPTCAIAVKKHPVDSLLRSERLPHILCPGCGIGTTMHCYLEAIVDSGVDVKNHVCVSGIGCSGRTAGYVKVDSYHTTHGRALPFALGIAVYRPELKVTVISGDGDLSSIGGNHLIHAARRNVDLTVICINNFNYGMTGGQAGPTTPMTAKSGTTPYGVADKPFNLPHLVNAVGANYVARWSVLHARQLKDSMLRAMHKPGFSFIEVLSPCPTGFGRPNDVGEGIEEMVKYHQRCKWDDNARLEDVDIDLMRPDSPIIVGNFVDRDRPAFCPPTGAPPAAPAAKEDSKKEREAMKHAH